MRNPLNGKITPRFLALWLILGLTLPGPGFALRVESPVDNGLSGGLEERLGAPVRGKLSFVDSLKDVYRLTLEAQEKELDERKGPSADIIFYSAGNDAMKSYYQDRDPVLRGFLYRSEVPVFSIPDPAGEKVGNGGAVGNVLLWLERRLPELQAAYAHLRGRGLADLRIVIVQAGGFGTRYTGGSSDGSKTLMPIPLELPNGEMMTAMDFALLGSYKFTQALRDRNQAGLVVLNGDGLLITEPKVVNGIWVITNPDSIRQAIGKLGVVVVDRKTDRIVAFLEKPEEIAKLRHHPQLQHLNFEDLEVRQLDTNTGSWVMTHADRAAYRRYLRGYLAVNELVLSRVGELEPVYDVDTSNDYFIPRTLSETEYIGQRLFKKEKNLSTYPTLKQLELLERGRNVVVNGTPLKGKNYQDQVRFYRHVYQLVKEKFPPLYAPAQDPHRTYYLDAGDDRSWYQLVSGGHLLDRVLGFESQIGSVILNGATVGRTSRLYQSIVDGKSTIVKEGAALWGSQLTEGSEIGSGSVVYNGKGKILLREEEMLVQQPVYIEEGDHKVRGWAIVYKDRDGRLTDEVAKARLFGRSLKDILERLKVSYQGEDSFMDLKIWPVTADREVHMKLVSWMSNGGEPPREYLDAPRVSYREMTKNIDYRRLRFRKVKHLEALFRAHLIKGDIPEDPGIFLDRLYAADRTLVRHREDLDEGAIRRNAALFEVNGQEITPKEKPWVELQIRLPEKFRAFSSRLARFRQDLRLEVPHLVLYPHSMDSLNITIARIKADDRRIGPDQWKKAVREISRLAGEKKPFEVEIKGASVTSKGEVVVHAVVRSPVLYELQREVLEGLPFAPGLFGEDSLQSVFLNVKLGRIIGPWEDGELKLKEADFRKLLEVVLRYQRASFGSFWVGSDGKRRGNKLWLVESKKWDREKIRRAKSFELGTAPATGLEETAGISAPRGEASWRHFLATGKERPAPLRLTGDGASDSMKLRSDGLVSLYRLGGNEIRLTVANPKVLEEGDVEAEFLWTTPIRGGRGVRFWLLDRESHKRRFPLYTYELFTRSEGWLPKGRIRAYPLDIRKPPPGFPKALRADGMHLVRWLATGMNAPKSRSVRLDGQGSFYLYPGAGGPRKGAIFVSQIQGVREVWVEARPFLSGQGKIRARGVQVWLPAEDGTPLFPLLSVELFDVARNRFLGKPVEHPYGLDHFPEDKIPNSHDLRMKRLIHWLASGENRPLPFSYRVGGDGIIWFYALSSQGRQRRARFSPLSRKSMANATVLIEPLNLSIPKGKVSGPRRGIRIWALDAQGKPSFPMKSGVAFEGGDFVFPIPWWTLDPSETRFSQVPTSREMSHNGLIRWLATGENRPERVIWKVQQFAKRDAVVWYKFRRRHVVSYIPLTVRRGRQDWSVGEIGQEVSIRPFETPEERRGGLIYIHRRRKTKGKQPLLFPVKAAVLYENGKFLPRPKPFPLREAMDLLAEGRKIQPRAGGASGAEVAEAARRYLRTGRKDGFDSEGLRTRIFQMVKRELIRQEKGRPSLLTEWERQGFPSRREEFLAEAASRAAQDLPGIAESWEQRGAPGNFLLPHLWARVKAHVRSMRKDYLGLPSARAGTVEVSSAPTTSQGTGARHGEDAARIAVAMEQLRTSSNESHRSWYRALHGHLVLGRSLRDLSQEEKVSPEAIRLREGRGKEWITDWLRQDSARASGLEEGQDALAGWGQAARGSDAVVLSREWPGLERLPPDLRARVYVVKGGLEEAAVKIIQQIPAAQRVWAEGSLAAPLQKMLGPAIFVYPVEPGSGLEEILAQMGSFLGVPVSRIQAGLEEIRKAQGMAAAA